MGVPFFPNGHGGGGREYGALAFCRDPDHWVSNTPSRVKHRVSRVKRFAGERGSAGRCGQLPREVRELRVAALHGSTALRVRAPRQGIVGSPPGPSRMVDWGTGDLTHGDLHLWQPIFPFVGKTIDGIGDPSPPSP